MMGETEMDIVPLQQELSKAIEDAIVSCARYIEEELADVHAEIALQQIAKVLESRDDLLTPKGLIFMQHYLKDDETT